MFSGGCAGYTGCFRPASASVPYGTTVTITAHAAQESEAYVGAWAGCNSANGATCTIVIDGNRTATPNFYGDGVDVTYRSVADSFGHFGTGYVTSTPDGLYCGDRGIFNTCRWRYHWSSNVVLRFNITDGTFQSWSGCDSEVPRNDGNFGTDCVVGAFGTRNVTATFVGVTIF